MDVKDCIDGKNSPAATPPLDRSPQSLPPDLAGTVSAGALIGTVGGAAVLGTGLAGPVGAVVGAIGGAVTGALAGKGIAETAVPDQDRYWQMRHSRQPYAKGRPYA